VGLRAGLDTKAREKLFRLCRGSNPVPQSVVRHYTELTQSIDLIHCKIIAELNSEQSDRSKLKLFPNPLM